MQDKWIRIYLCIAAVWVCTLAACGLPGELKKQAKQKTGQITSAREHVSKLETDFQNLKTTAAFDFFRMYAEKEDWQGRFTEAVKMLDQADKDVTSGKVAFLIKENNKEKAPALRIELASIDRMITKALLAAGSPKERMIDLERIRDNAAQLVKTAENSFQAILPYIGDLEDGLIPKAQEDHPKRADDVMARFVPLKTLEQSAEAALIAARAQLALHEAGETADYAILGAKTDQVNANLQAVKEGDKTYRDKIGELYKSYTKILKDMRIDYYVTVGRVSWDENSDYWREHNLIYPASKVTPEVYAYFAKLNPNVVPAKFTTRSGWYAVSVQPNPWKALKINPGQNWPSRSDNMAEFWIDNFFSKAYQKYTLVQNDKKEDTDWIEVDEEDYYDTLDYLGMEILSKPYGFFEEEKVTEASPPGMAFVGDSRYGEWRTDPGTGRSFWYYYGLYSFLNRGVGYRTYRGDWGRWQGKYRNREPYYGGSGSSGRAYGTYGTHVRTDSRYRNTDFAKRGGLKTQTPSVRGAGPAGRGGGPGARGK